MASIYLETWINAPRQLVFDLARSIDLHQESARETNEKAIAGRTSGLIGLNETVTWRAKHLGFYQELTTRITLMQVPERFEDVMEKGIFKRLHHIHLFEEKDSGTLMTDQFIFTSPLGWLGKAADRLFLTHYLKGFLIKRNKLLKKRAEHLQNQSI
ncbi:cell division protein [Taibaiella sp. KBW10]|uniref:SRPBCC family protein n=1 Tax=Taibaiella sp. KBW10 TaxID=2153357 RepID=UPI000F5942C5|nr:SRPBCC family protein [Taibaiella sp. KBW10]RQO32192.1 cell division protein [Taibaiella sp. KBW10]